MNKNVDFLTFFVKVPKLLNRKCYNIPLLEAGVILAQLQTLKIWNQNIVNWRRNHVFPRGAFFLPHPVSPCIYIYTGWAKKNKTRYVFIHNYTKKCQVSTTFATEIKGAICDMLNKYDPIRLFGSKVMQLLSRHPSQKEQATILLMYPHHWYS